MRLVHAGTRHGHDDTRAGEVVVVSRHSGVGRDGHAHAGQVIEQHALMMNLDLLHDRRAGQCHQAPRLRANGEEMTKRRRLLAHDLGSQLRQCPRGRERLTGEREHVEQLAGGDGRLLNRGHDHLRAEFVVRLEGHDALRARHQRQLARGLGRGLDEVGVVRDVAHHRRAHRAQLLTKGIVQRAARLRHVAARSPVRAQVIGDRQRRADRGVQMGIAQENGRVTAEE